MIENANYDYDYDCVVAFYKFHKYLNRGIRNIFNQTLKPKNIIFVNDGDLSLKKKDVEIIFQNSEINLIYIDLKKNLGAVGATKIGINYVKSKYFRTSALDDIMHKQLAEKSINLIKQYPDSGMVFSDPGFFLDNRSKDVNIKLKLSNDLIYFDRLETRKILLQRNFKPHSPTIFFNTKKFMISNLFDKKYGYMADLLTNWKIMIEYGCNYIPENLAYSTIHEDQWSKKQSNKYDIKFHEFILDDLKLNHQFFYKKLYQLNLYYDFPLRFVIKLKKQHNKFIKFKIIIRTIKYNIWNFAKERISLSVLSYFYKKFS